MVMPIDIVKELEELSIARYKCNTSIDYWSIVNSATEFAGPFSAQLKQYGQTEEGRVWQVMQRKIRDLGTAYVTADSCFRSRICDEVSHRDRIIPDLLGHAAECIWLVREQVDVENALVPLLLVDRPYFENGWVIELLQNLSHVCEKRGRDSTAAASWAADVANPKKEGDDSMQDMLLDMCSLPRHED